MGNDETRGPLGVGRRVAAVVGGLALAAFCVVAVASGDHWEYSGGVARDQRVVELIATGECHTHAFFAYYAGKLNLPLAIIHWLLFAEHTAHASRAVGISARYRNEDIGPDAGPPGSPVRTSNFCSKPGTNATSVGV